ncbi:MAG TPA: tRNA preQ1(34) S-adenosylmethionine ribosyltransferase-isomerase QueA [Oligoflexia bacterium]|nr:tRNA preQ1(34) S-adenosylmethionine ribosyltransferase-isomerase QueA [Oligoflexia bacterium]HMP49830.1 tRNA preQ1(34) S-adenosylmethionine ribosyltransferase-isomerase QueA [Oligoflexia bacterium]
MDNLFSYELPEERIALRHAGFSGRRDDSRLLSLSFSDSGFLISDKSFSDVRGLLNPGDLLVFNNTRVIPTRFFVSPSELSVNSSNTDNTLFEKSSYEVFLVARKQESQDLEIWEALARPMKAFREGIVFKLCLGIKAKVLGKSENKRFLLLQLAKDDSIKEINAIPEESILSIIEREGSIPIPPYIRGGRSDDSDRNDYQTVFAAQKGSVAAPTAGLHFTDEILEDLLSSGVSIEFLTLHVGAASILPLKDDSENELNSENRPGIESFFVSSDLWSKILKTKESGKRVIAVGTTVVRAIETLALSEDTENMLDSWQESNLFIVPGFQFKVVDCMFTNFHQPRSTHLALVEAFIGSKAIKALYRHALDNNYRFLSYGDSTFIELNKGSVAKWLF